MYPEAQDQQEKCFQPEFSIKSRDELRMFVAGVASAAHIIFGEPVSERQVAACLANCKHEQHFGGVFCVLEDLDDMGVLLAHPEEGKPTTYPLIDQEFSRRQLNDAIELMKKFSETI